MGIGVVVETDGVAGGAGGADDGEGIVGLLSRDQQAGGGFGERDVDDLAVLGGEGVGFSWGVGGEGLEWEGGSGAVLGCHSGEVGGVWGGRCC